MIYAPAIFAILRECFCKGRRPGIVFRQADVILKYAGERNSPLHKPTKISDL